MEVWENMILDNTLCSMLDTRFWMLKSMYGCMIVWNIESGYWILDFRIVLGLSIVGLMIDYLGFVWNLGFDVWNFTLCSMPYALKTDY